jgi:hypothetical protein
VHFTRQEAPLTALSYNVVTLGTPVILQQYTNYCDSIEGEKMTEKDENGSGHGLFQAIIPASASRD